MNRPVIALTGISGVGKTTFLRQLAEQVDFQHLTGGSLIAAAREVQPEVRDTIRYTNLDENQRLLIEGFALKRDPTAALIVMDGHVVIDEGERLAKISSDVFRALEVSIMVHLESEPEQIAANRREDTSRSRPNYPLYILEQHQIFSRAHANAITNALGVPFYPATHTGIDQVAALFFTESAKHS